MLFRLRVHYFVIGVGVVLRALQVLAVEVGSGGADEGAVAVGTAPVPIHLHPEQLPVGVARRVALESLPDPVN